MRTRNTKKSKESLVTDAYEPFNIVALSHDDEHVILSADDFEKLLTCRDMVLYAWNSKRDLPYPLVKEVLSRFS